MNRIRFALVLLLALSSAPCGGAELNIGVDISEYPQLVLVPGFPVYYAPEVGANYFFYDGDFWIFQDDNWYSSPWYDGPWNGWIRRTCRTSFCRFPCATTRCRRHISTVGGMTTRRTGASIGAMTGSGADMTGTNGIIGLINRHRCRIISANTQEAAIPRRSSGRLSSRMNTTVTGRMIHWCCNTSKCNPRKVNPPRKTGATTLECQAKCSTKLSAA